MTERHVSIGKVKRDISELVNRVAYGGERIVLTSRGKPKAVIVSLDDYERLERIETQTALAEWQAWVTDSQALAASKRPASRKLRNPEPHPPARQISPSERPFSSSNPTAS